MSDEPENNSDAQAKPEKKTGARLWLMILVPALIVVGGAWYWLSAGNKESTENASFQAARIPIATQISGRVTRVFVSENEHVTQGAPLFEIDRQPYELALAKVEAALASAKLQVEQLRAAYKAALAKKKQAQDNYDYEEKQLARQEKLTASGTATQTALDTQRITTRAAEDALSAARQNVASARVALDGNPDIALEDHPTIKAAVAAVNEAKYNLSLTEVTAPADGVIYKASSFKPGEMVRSGSRLFTLVDTSDVWVIANFKETDLTHMAAGQRARITFDTFPGRDYDATVESLGAGTGAEFSILPAQNATGNWVKVTQRVPVRLRLDEGSNIDGLRAGLSAKVTVYTDTPTNLQGLMAKAGQKDR